MGIFCMVFGVVIFLGFTGGGFLLANALISAPSSLGPSGLMVDFIGIPSDPAPYIILCAFIGLLIGLSFFMQGLTYQKVSKIARRRRERDR